MNRRLRLGMVGGGQGAFIGAVHRMAARMTDAFDLVAGALSSDPARSLASAVALGISPDRSYEDFSEMAKREAQREDGIDVVAIVTPNHLHFAAARAFLEAGIHVICDKPVTSTYADAQALQQIAEASGKLFILTHNYTGYPMVREAQSRVKNGRLGALRFIQVEYTQDWLATAVETTGVKQAAWRTDPDKAGIGGALGDIGTHAWNLAAFISGEIPSEILADLSTFVEGRQLDDNAMVLLRYANGASGSLWVSQVAMGYENRLSIRLIGEKASLEWNHDMPDQLLFTPLNDSTQKLTRQGPGVGEASKRVSHVPGGHPEGYLEAFCVIYAEAARAINATKTDTDISKDVQYPTLCDGISGLAFVQACVLSSRRGGTWVKL
jgi:predicted dehydrogenase